MSVNSVFVLEVIMNNFLQQIKEDIVDYQEKYPHIENLKKDEWAFNFWILDKLYSEEEDLIEEKIVDYNDKGIDCYIWHEDLQDLYIIQNKFYSEETQLSSTYVKEFLHRPISFLESGSYTRCDELQKIYNQNKNNADFKIHLCIYVTNNICKTESILEIIQKFNTQEDSICDAKIFSLDDIESLYFKEPLTNKKNLTFSISTINKGTALNINNDDYDIAQNIDARYVLVPVVELYYLYQEAAKSNYPIFDANIREYLGSTGAVNKKIKKTLEDPNDRINFFFYNNGITMIVDDFTRLESVSGKRKFQVINPQIVNGCQTVSTINETLSNRDQNTLNIDFKDTYVMLKILKIPANDTDLESLYKNIVTYNNSQNSINQKTFVANSDEFKRLQSEFERKGFLICIKQSDKNTYTTKKYKTPSQLIERNSKLIELFGIETTGKTKDYCIDLEKFLQVLLAYISTTQDAVQNKSKLLNPSTRQYEDVMSFIKNPDVTINTLLELYLLYLRAEQEKKKSADGKNPIPLYLINCFAKYSCKKSVQNVHGQLETKDMVNQVIDLYRVIIKAYATEWKISNSDKDYNAMIKSPLDEELLEKQYKVYSGL